MAATVATVTSPPKMLTVEMSDEAFALADGAGRRECARGHRPRADDRAVGRIGERAGQRRRPGGAETEAEEPPAWPGTATWMAKPRAETFGAFADRTAPAEPTEETSKSEPEGYWGEPDHEPIIKHRRDDRADSWETSRLA